MNQPKYFLEAEKITFRKGAVPIIDKVSFGAAPGEFLLITGNDLSVKTSLLKICAGLVQPHQGELKINGRPLSDFTYSELQLFRQKTGFVFRDGVQVSNMTIRENIALPLRYNSRFTDREINTRVGKHVDSLNLGGYANERPAGLSLEIKLLASLARALVIEPDLLLLDELFGSLNRAEVTTAVGAIKDYRVSHCLTCLATSKLVNVMTKSPWESLVDCIILIEDGGVTEYGTCQMLRENLKQ